MKRSCLVSLLAMLSAAVLSGCAATAQGGPVRRLAFS